VRVLKLDVGEGLLHLQLDTLDDLWALRNLVARGDLVTADTQRTAEAPADKLRDAKMPKRAMRLGVRAESVEWHDFDDHLRVLGPIETGPQDHGRHHTLVLRADGMDVVIQKRGPLSPWHLRQAKEAVAATQVPQVVLLAIDDTEAQFALLKSYGVQLLGSLPAGALGKRFAGAESAKLAFYDEALKTLLAVRPDPTTPALVIGPGWWREEFIEHVRRKAPAAAQGLMTEGTAHGGRTGVHEAVRNGLVERVSRDHRVGRETQLVEEMLARIAKGDGTVAYGAADVARAVEAGAAETVLASDAAVRTGEHEDLLRRADAARADVVIVSGGHDAGVRLHRMGGLAALLRYALDQPLP
jgi:protein pelota